MVQFWNIAHMRHKLDHCVVFYLNIEPTRLDVTIWIADQSGILVPVLSILSRTISNNPKNAPM